MKAMNLIRTLTTGSLAALTLAAAPIAFGDVLLSDDYTVDANVNDPNYMIERQTGPLSDVSYIWGGNAQVGNADTFPGSDHSLLLAFGANALLDYDLAQIAGPVTISFDGLVSDGATTDDTTWLSFTLSGGTTTPGVTQADFGILFRANGGSEVWDAGAGATGPSVAAPGFDVWSSYRFVIADTAGTGSGFSGNGTVVTYSVNGSVLGSVALDPELSSGYFSLGSTSIAGYDNLVLEGVPEPGSLALLGLGGLLIARRRRA